jgi:hypothetical protein
LLGQRAFRPNGLIRQPEIAPDQKLEHVVAEKVVQLFRNML